MRPPESPTPQEGLSAQKKGMSPGAVRAVRSGEYKKIFKYLPSDFDSWGLFPLEEGNRYYLASQEHEVIGIFTFRGKTGDGLYDFDGICVDHRFYDNVGKYGKTWFASRFAESPYMTQEKP
jgi:hypothetical protein